MDTKKRLLIIFLLVCFPIIIFSQTNRGNGSEILEEGISRFQEGNYESAVVSFRELLIDPAYQNYRGDAYFWIAKAGMALNRLDDAEKNLEYFLLNYQNNVHYPEANYQKGRLLLLQQEYQKAIQVFQTFIERFPNSPYIANAYFWTAESLYKLGHLDEAQKMYMTVIQDYPASYRVEAAQYRNSLIDLKKREEELLKLLRWSHEESLKLLEELQKKEKMYNEALASYQDQLKSLSGEDDRQEISRLNAKIQSLEEELTEKNKLISQYESQIIQLSSAESGDSGQSNTSSELSNDEIAALKAELENKLELVKIKEEALKLKESLIDSLESTEESDGSGQ